MKTPDNHWDEQERRLAAELGLRPPRPRPGCIRPDRLMAFSERALDEPAQREVEEHLATCPECASLLTQLREWETPAATAEEVAAVWARIAPRAHQPARVAWRGRMWWLAAAAAAGLAAIPLLMAPAPPEAPRMVGRAPSPPAIRVVEMSMTEPAPVRLPLDGLLVWRNHRAAAAPPPETLELAAALEPYRKGDFAAAAERLAAVSASQPDSYEALFYRGVSLLMLDRAPEAAASLAQAQALAPDSQKREAAWYLALAQLREHKVAAARPALEAACQSGSRFAPTACGILRHLAAPRAPTSTR